MQNFFDGCCIALLCALLSGCVFAVESTTARQNSMHLFDDERERNIPIHLYFPNDEQACTSVQPCPVAFVSAGYGLGYLDYSFIADSLNRLGYLVVSIQHQLPDDAPIKTSGDIYKDRSPMWERGAQNIRFVKDYLSTVLPVFDWQHPVLIGHSNGGDISAWLARESNGFASAIITLDHRRVPLPRGTSPKVLSIRASDFEADPDVLPSEEEQRQFGICIVKLEGERHNDMYDGGSIKLKKKITTAMEAFLEAQYTC